MVPPTWYANPSYTRCPIGAEPDEDPDSTQSWVRQLASQPVDDTAANELLDQALAGIDAKALSSQDEEAAEVASGDGGADSVWVLLVCEQFRRWSPHLFVGSPGATHAAQNVGARNAAARPTSPGTPLVEVRGAHRGRA